jgi:hypothetical protein
VARKSRILSALDRHISTFADRREAARRSGLTVVLGTNAWRNPNADRQLAVPHAAGLCCFEAQ